MSRESDFFQQYWPAAVRATQGTNVSPYILLGQIAQETGYGAKVRGNNPFNITAGKGWGGETMVRGDATQGDPGRQQRFRVYGSLDDAMADYVKLIQTAPRYRGLLAGSTAERAAALGQSGYAEDPTYGEKVGNLANRFEQMSGGTGGAYSTAGASVGPQPDAGGGYTPSELPPEGIITDVPGGVTAAPGRLARNGAELEEMLKERFPYLRVTSRTRSEEHNRAVGGAKGSQHLHGNAIDIGMSELSPAQREEITRYALSIGARGVGYYPNSNSMHFDTRPNPAFWGPNKSRTSLPQTPDWFQNVARGGAPTVAEPGTAAGVSPAPAAAPAGLLGDAAPAPSPQAPGVAPNTDAARALSDPARYGIDPAVAAQLRAFVTPGGGFGNIQPPAVPPPVPALQPSAPAAQPPGVLSQSGPPPPAPGTREPTAAEREATRKYLEPMGPGPIGIWNPEKIWWQNPATRPATPPSNPLEELQKLDPNGQTYMAQQPPAPIIGEPPPGQQGQAMNLIEDYQKRRPLSLLGGGWA